MHSAAAQPPAKQQPAMQQRAMQPPAKQQPAVQSATQLPNPPEYALWLTLDVVHKRGLYFATVRTAELQEPWLFLPPEWWDSRFCLRSGGTPCSAWCTTARHGSKWLCFSSLALCTFA